MTRSQIANAAVLWALGCDTLKISERLMLPESDVYNALSSIREERHKIKRRVSA